MNYQTFPPPPDLESLVKCYWTLEVPAEASSQQQIIPDGCLELIFILGDNIRRFTTSDQFVLQPRAMVLGQFTKPFLVEPTGYVNSFATRFYPYGFANFITTPIGSLANEETPIELLFGEQPANDLHQKIIDAADTKERIEIVENFLRDRLSNQVTIEGIVKETLDTLFATNGSASINAILRKEPSKRRSLERNFMKQVGLSPKQLGKVTRLHAALKMLLNNEPGDLTRIAYDNEYSSLSST